MDRWIDGSKGHTDLKSVCPFGLSDFRSFGLSVFRSSGLSVFRSSGPPVLRSSCSYWISASLATSAVRIVSGSGA